MKKAVTEAKYIGLVERGDLFVQLRAVGHGILIEEKRCWHEDLT